MVAAAPNLSIEAAWCLMGRLRQDEFMVASMWSPVSFTAGPLGMFEAVYLDDDGQLIRVPIIGVLIEEEVQLGADGKLAGTGRLIR